MQILYEPNPSVAYWLTLVVTLLLPILVAFVTKASTSSAVKSVVLLALSAVTAIGSNLLSVNGATDVGPMVTSVLSTFVIAVASYFGFWRGTVTPAVQVMGNKDTLD
jgi:hypothetical protein